MLNECKRCFQVKETKFLHYDKQQGWLCDNRMNCTKRLNEIGDANE